MKLTEGSALAVVVEFNLNSDLTGNSVRSQIANFVNIPVADVDVEIAENISVRLTVCGDEEKLQKLITGLENGELPGMNSDEGLKVNFYYSCPMRDSLSGATVPHIFWGLLFISLFVLTL
jgi:hypothetical protein